MSKVCIVGAGAIGGLIGARIAATGRHQVSALARGETLAALQRHGWRLRTSDGLVQAPVTACQSAEDLGPQELVIIAVKGPAMPAVSSQITPLIGPKTLVLSAMNGVPWWFVDGDWALGGGPLQSVDPGGAIARSIPFRQVLGAVVHASAFAEQPGLVVHRMGQGIIVGEPGGHVSLRSSAVAALLADAGFEVTQSARIRTEVWYKLWGNLTMNPISAITGATTDRILADPLVRSFCSAAMREAAEIGACIGCVIDQTPEDRHVVTARLGAFKTSMLQDAEAGRPLELDTIVAAVREIGARLGVATPGIDALLGLSRLFGRVHGLYPDDFA